MLAREHKFIEPWPIREDTPWEKKRKIHQIEWEIERMEANKWRAVTALAVFAVAALVICLADCWGWIDLF